MPRDRYLQQSLGALHPQIQQSRILVVGAGGIGCELLKNLVTTGFGEIHVVDLDTIDLSNLNRQFLFRHAHIKKSKALVAKEAAGAFNPHVKIQAYHDNIKEQQFNVAWFSTFSIVFNALDNLDARRHVNKMCLAANVPLIESGTTGFNGQVQPIKKGVTQCYDCNPKETPKSFPVCTIRSTPSQPIHCIVWAKSYLFCELFGVSEDAPDVDHSEDAENQVEIENLRREAAALQSIRDSMGSEDFARKVFTKVYTEDVARLCSMEDMWKSRKPPQALDYDEQLRQTTSIPPTIQEQDQRVWTLAENVAVFNSSLVRLSRRMQDLKEAHVAGDTAPVLSFDKDDKDTLDFVAAAANLRSLVFGIDPKSEFDIKQMAGNIIPAIATTNATTAALCVLQAFKVMQGDMNKAKMVFLAKSTDRVIDRETLQPPNPMCAVCGNVQAQVLVDPAKVTIESLVDVLKSKLGYTDEISIATDAGLIYDPDLEENLPKTLVDMGVTKDSFMTVMDGEDEPRVDLVLAVINSDAPDSTIGILPSDIVLPRKPKPAPVMDDEDKAADSSANGIKRKRDVNEPAVEGEVLAKRGKPTSDLQEAIVINGGDGGVIELD